MNIGCVETWMDETLDLSARVSQSIDFRSYSLPNTPRVFAEGAREMLIANYGETQTFYLSQLFQLPDKGLAVALPFTVTTEQIDITNFVSSIQDAGIYASGDSLREAIENLGSTLCHVYHRLQRLSDEQIGKRAKRQKTVLNRHLTKVSYAAQV
jgi:hypothetical protein